MITSRRTFLKTTALSGASLLIGIDGNRLLHGAQPLAAGHFKPNVWIRIDPDNSVTLTIGKSEMGQGVRTSLAMLLAEELEADWTRIKLEQASPEPGFEDIGTGGSDSIRDGWRSLRQAGATAREMLAMAAAARWKVDRGTFAGAKPKRMQEEKARAVHGVRAIVKISNGVAVVADTTWAAIKGRTTLAVEWDDPPPDAFNSEAHAKRLETGSRERGFITRKEEPPPGTARVAETIDATYHYPFYAHAPVETMNWVADVRENRCTIWAPTQAPNRLQKQVAQLLGTTPANVQVNVTLIGGGFGRRLAVDYALEAAEISRAAKAPIQLLWSRPDDMKHGHFQGASVHYLSAGLDAQGTPIAWRHTKAGSFHNISALDPAEVRDAAWYQDWSWGAYDVPYAFPAIETAYVAVDLPVRHGPWRAVFAPSSVFAREAFFDEVAHHRGADPLAFRLDMLKGTVVIKAGSTTIDRRRLRHVLETVRNKSGWGRSIAEHHGRGVACNAYFGHTYIAYVADVAVDHDGNVRVERVVAAVDCGRVINPIGVEQQMEGGIIWGISSALKGEITFRDGAAQQGTYADFEVARMRETPAIEVHIVNGDAPEPFGMGEPPVPPIVPAIVNAVFAATGKRVRQLPIRPALLLS